MSEQEQFPFGQYLGKPGKLSEAVITASQKSNRLVITKGLPGSPKPEPHSMLTYPNCGPNELCVDILDPRRRNFLSILQAIFQNLEILRSPQPPKPKVDYYTVGGVYLLPTDRASSKMIDRIIRTTSDPWEVRQKVDEVVKPLPHIGLFVACPDWNSHLGVWRIIQDVRENS